MKDAVRDCGFESSHNISKLDDEKESLDREIQKELFYSDNVYDTMDIGGSALFLKTNSSHSKTEFCIFREMQ